MKERNKHRKRLQRLIERDNGQCAYCKAFVYPVGEGPHGIQLPEGHQHTATKDHLTPKHAGGKDALTNIVLACYECNQRLARIEL